MREEANRKMEKVMNIDKLVKERQKERETKKATQGKPRRFSIS
jgi:hypothetical protein